MEVLENTGENQAGMGGEGMPRVFSLDLLSKDFSASFLTDIHSEEHIARFLHRSGVFCPACGVSITAPAIVEKFYHLQESRSGALIWQECYCPDCGKRFTPWTGTLLNGAHDKKTVFLIALYTRFGADAQTIAEQLGIHPDTVRLWQAKFRAFERTDV